MSVTRCFTAVAKANLRPRVIVSVGVGAPRSASAGSQSVGVGCRATSTAPARTQELKAMFITEERGSPYAHDYRVYFKDASGPISPLHDIPLFAERGAGEVEEAGPAARLVNMVVEVPRWTNAKMEISLSEPLNPIKQDVKKGALRYVANVFPHRGYIWNYGALPQTWEDPRHVDPATGARGDNDPVDVLEIGSRVAARGDVYPVRVLGALALIDEGETDWKLLAIDARDPLACSLRGPQDIERLMPGLLRATVEWFRLYKVPDGKPVNQFAFDAQPKDAEFAHKVIDEVHGFWRALVSGEVGDNTAISTMNVSVAESPGLVERAQASAALGGAPVRGLPQPLPSTGTGGAQASAALGGAPVRGLPQPLPSTVDKWHFVSNL